MKAHAANVADAVVYRDRFTGRAMERPGWQRLWADVLAGKVQRIVVWRLDRLGRTVSGLSRLFEELHQRRVGLVSLRDGLDLNTAAGRLMAHVLASVAAYEVEVKSESGNRSGQGRERRAVLVGWSEGGNAGQGDGGSGEGDTGAGGRRGRHRVDCSGVRRESGYGVCSAEYGALHELGSTLGIGSGAFPSLARSAQHHQVTRWT